MNLRALANILMGLIQHKKKNELETATVMLHTDLLLLEN